MTYNTGLYITAGGGNTEPKILVTAKFADSGYTMQKCCVFNPHGISPTILASGFKDPIKIVVEGRP